MLVEEFALLEAGFAIVRILQTFPDIRASKNPSEEESSRMESAKTGTEAQTLTLVLSSADGCWVEMRRSE